MVDPELTSLTSTPKSQLYAEQPSMKKSRTYQKRSPPTKDIKELNEMGRRGRFMT